MIYVSYKYSNDLWHNTYSSRANKSIKQNRSGPYLSHGDDNNVENTWQLHGTPLIVLRSDYYNPMTKILLIQRQN